MRRFSTFEAAALHVSRLRSEGYFAETIHENAAHLYGPILTKGVSVVCSEEAIDLDNDEHPALGLEPELPTLFKFCWRMVRNLAGVLLVIALVLTLLQTAKLTISLSVFLLAFIAAVPSSPELLQLPILLAAICYFTYRAILWVKNPNSKLGKGIRLFLTMTFLIV